MRLSFTSLMVRALKAMLVSIAINLLLYLLFVRLGIIDVSLPVTPDGRSLSWLPVLFASFVPILAAAIICWLLDRLFPQKSIIIFRMLASIILVLSFATPFTIEAVPMQMALGLNVMHIVVGISTIYFLTNKASSNEQ